MKAGLMMVAACLAAASAPLSAAGLYQWQDAQGRTVYSDQAPPPSTAGVQQRAFKGSVIEVGESYATQVARQKHPVTLYTSACGAPCDQARQLLAARGIPHAARDLETSETARAELEKLTGRLNVPVLRVGDEKIEGFEKGRWQAALDRAGYPKPAFSADRPAAAR
jgi:Glutaredoxin and related proteins